MGVMVGRRIIYCKNLKKGKERANGQTEHDWIRFWMFWLITEVNVFQLFHIHTEFKGYNMITYLQDNNKNGI